MTPAALLLRRTIGPLCVLAVGAGIVVAVRTARQDPGVEVTLAFTVPVPTRGTAAPGAIPRETESAFEALQAAELFAGTLVGWLSSPDVAAAVYGRAGVDFPHISVRRLSRAFVATKQGGQVVAVRFRSRSEEEGRALATAIPLEVNARAEAFNRDARELRFGVVAGVPLVVPVRFSPALRGLLAAVVVFVLGVNAVLLWDFFRPRPWLSERSDTRA